MGSLFRSEEMTLCILYLQSETAYLCIAELGEFGLVQFKDLNADVNSYKRKFVNELRRCDEMERQLRYFEHEIRKEGLPICDFGSIPEAPAPSDMIDLEATYASHESEIREMTTAVYSLQQTHLSLAELRHVLEHTENFFRMGRADVELAEMQPTSPHSDTTTTSSQQQQQPYVRYVCGVIQSRRMPGFMRLLWFACKGNVFMRHTDIEEAYNHLYSADVERKSVFMIFFQGDQLDVKVKKICEGYRATLYPCPDSAAERQKMSIDLKTKMADLEMVLNKTREQRYRVLQSVAENLTHWNLKVLKVKAVYHTLSMLNTQAHNFVAECWVPVAQIGAVQLMLNRVTERAGTFAPSLLHAVESDRLPTYHRTNKFTKAFQQIIDAYGIASYQEVNAAPFAIITFPFLFSVMFGDAGHALVMLLFALFLVLYERRLVAYSENSEVFKIIFGGRYMILMMAVFSVYSGLLYNDTFSKSFNMFGTSWSANDTNTSGIPDANTHVLSPMSAYDGNPYPFGVDPVWQMAKNKLSFTNSFKKKISVIFGVSQMLLGVVLSLCNHIHFHQPLNIICDFIPQLLFLLSIFGYLCALVFAKWAIFKADQSGCAPSLLIGFINVFMMKYPDSPCNVKPWYPGQQKVEMSLLLVAAFSALWMLFVKPLYLYLRTRASQRMLVLPHDSPIAAGDTAAILPETLHGSINTGETIAQTEQFSEVMIQQAIHTIEFCLGCVSHSASYLRLWALSLAHVELSEVLWTMVFRNGLGVSGYAGCAAVFIVFPPFAFLTVAILLLMEGLSAFLHTLRLHWVEFQSKFYTGEGFAFEPFSFKQILTSYRMNPT